jgi:methylated-DNA-[protein]-cysteine S-methyltransferase
MELLYADVPSPIGTVRLVARSNGVLCSIDFTDNWDSSRRRLETRFGGFVVKKDRSLFGHVARLKRYLAGDVRALDRVKVDPGGSTFQRKVWSALRKVPPGKTISYGALAERIGAPGAARAVGAANRTNPIPIIIPCHRVIGADGALTGYAGGLHRKKWLLRHEGARCSDR